MNIILGFKFCTSHKCHCLIRIDSLFLCTLNAYVNVNCTHGASLSWPINKGKKQIHTYAQILCRPRQPECNVCTNSYTYQIPRICMWFICSTMIVQTKKSLCPLAKDSKSHRINISNGNFVYLVVCMCSMNISRLSYCRLLLQIRDDRLRGWIFYMPNWHSRTRTHNHYLPYMVRCAYIYLTLNTVRLKIMTNAPYFPHASRMMYICRCHSEYAFPLCVQSTRQHLQALDFY